MHYINPFVPEFIIPAKLLNTGDIMVGPEHMQSGVITHFLVPSFGQNDSSMDIIMYSCVQEEL